MTKKQYLIKLADEPYYIVNDPNGSIGSNGVGFYTKREAMNTIKDLKEELDVDST